MTKFMKTTAALLLASSFTSTSFAHPDRPNDPIEPIPSEEILQGLTTNQIGFTIQVDSNGCTDKSSFELLIRESYPAQVQVVRKSEDRCRAYTPYGTKITYSYQELGLTSPRSFTIVNEINSGLLPKR